ncbi:hypothetical protein PTKIN_Ptkin03bG0148400 [Pterospermum kingtungense]
MKQTHPLFAIIVSSKSLLGREMAISIRCCLNTSPPTPTLGLGVSSSNSKSKAPQVAWDDKWRRQCALGVACLVIGLQVVGDINNSNAIAKETSIPKESKSRSVARWSDKRTCPPWHVNSLETIVPENLPRPSAHRRWEAIGFSNNINAPAVKVTTGITKTRNSCFSM